MGSIVLYMQISLDGIVSDVDRWASIDDGILEGALEYYNSLDAIVIGANSYPSMAEYWQQAELASESALERSFAKRINELPKIVLSRMEMELAWKNTELLLYRDEESLVRGIESLRGRMAKDISVESGVRTWQRLLRHDLFDELRLLVHPAVAKVGEKLFAGAEESRALLLESARVYDSGVVELHYRKKG